MERVRKSSVWWVMGGEEVKFNSFGCGGMGVAVSCSVWNAESRSGSWDWMRVMVSMISSMSFEALRCRSVEMESCTDVTMCSDAGLKS